jgi:hypothetical protein
LLLRAGYFGHRNIGKPRVPTLQRLDHFCGHIPISGHDQPGSSWVPMRFGTHEPTENNQAIGLSSVPRRCHISMAGGYLEQIYGLHSACSQTRSQTLQGTAGLGKNKWRQQRSKEKRPRRIHGKPKNVGSHPSSLDPPCARILPTALPYQRQCANFMATWGFQMLPRTCLD